MKLELGEKVKIHGRLFRIWDNGMKVWREISHDLPFEGVWVGYRTLSNGRVYYGGAEDGTEYQALEYLHANMVVVDPRQSPVYVLDKDMEVI